MCSVMKICVCVRVESEQRCVERCGRVRGVCSTLSTHLSILQSPYRRGRGV